MVAPLPEEDPHKAEDNTPAEQAAADGNSESIHTMEKVAAEEVDTLMEDSVAETLVVLSAEGAGSGKQGIINLGVISAAFQAGDVVDLQILKDKGMIDANVGRLKVLSAGTLDKPLIVKAESFSTGAIKMITLTGGQAIKLSN